MSDSLYVNPEGISNVAGPYADAADEYDKLSATLKDMLSRYNNCWGTDSTGQQFGPQYQQALSQLQDQVDGLGKSLGYYRDNLGQTQKLYEGAGDQSEQTAHDFRKAVDQYGQQGAPGGQQRTEPLPAPSANDLAGQDQGQDQGGDTGKKWLEPLPMPKQGEKRRYMPAEPDYVEDPPTPGQDHPTYHAEYPGDPAGSSVPFDPAHPAMTPRHLHPADHGMMGTPANGPDGAPLAEHSLKQPAITPRQDQQGIPPQDSQNGPDGAPLAEHSLKQPAITPRQDQQGIPPQDSQNGPDGAPLAEHSLKQPAITPRQDQQGIPPQDSQNGPDGAPLAEHSLKQPAITPRQDQQGIPPQDSQNGPDGAPLAEHSLKQPAITPRQDQQGIPPQDSQNGPDGAPS